MELNIREVLFPRKSGPGELPITPFTGTRWLFQGTMHFGGPCRDEPGICTPLHVPRNFGDCDWLQSV